MNEDPLSTHKYYVKCIWITDVPTLPASFLRVSTVFIISWFFHKWVDPGGCDSQQWARDTREVDKTWGDAAEENWAWWDHRYLFNTSSGSTRLLLLPFPLSFSPPPPSPLLPHSFPTPSPLLPHWFWQLLKPSPSNHIIPILLFTSLSGCQAWIWEALNMYI